MTRPAIRPELAAGTIIGGDFEVIERLAGGGMGEVYIARQRSTGALRAVKRLHAHLLEDDVSRTRFEREAKVVARIESQHVAQVITAGVDSARREPFIAMEYLRGETISKALARGPLPREEALRVMGGVAHALAAAHRVGVVHRDLKPDNVMLAESQLAGISSVVKVLDFGIALVAKGTLSARITGDLSVGTPPYMAPEQFADSERIGPHTDVWAMGLLLFEMLTGVRFWQSSAKSGGTLATLIQEIVEQPIAPSALRAMEKGASVEPPLAAWIDLCLQREPTRRFATAQDALDALLRVQNGPASSLVAQPAAPQRAPATQAMTVGSPPAFVPPPLAPARSNTTALVAGATVVVALLLLGAISMGLARRRVSAAESGEVALSPQQPQQVPPKPQPRPHTAISQQQVIDSGTPSAIEPVRLAPTPPAVATRSGQGVQTRGASSPNPTSRSRAPIEAAVTVGSAPSRHGGSEAPAVFTRSRFHTVRSLVFQVLRETGCFDRRTIEAVRGSVSVVVAANGNIISATTDSDYWSCLVRARLTTRRAPPWHLLFHGTFPLRELYR